MNLAITIKDIQHINELNFNIDLSKNQLLCIVGKNGAGKTTLIRALKNLNSADTFTKTASPYIFKSTSYIKYTIDNEEYLRNYVAAAQTFLNQRVTSYFANGFSCGK